MDQEEQLIVREIVMSIRRVVRSLYLDSKKMVKQFGLTGPQSHVVRILTSLGPLSSAELSRHLYVTQANMTGIIDRLEKKDLVKRSKKLSDRRVSLIELSEMGVVLGQSLPDPIEEKLIIGLGDLEPAEIYGIYAAIKKVVDLIDAKDIVDAPLYSDTMVLSVSDSDE